MKISKPHLLSAVATLTFLSSPLIPNPSVKLFVRATALTGAVAGLCFKTPEEQGLINDEMSRISKERQEMTEQYLADTATLEEWAKGEEARLTEQAKAIVEANVAECQQIIDGYLGEIEQLQSYNAELMERIQLYQLPKHARGTSRLETIANRCIDFFYERGIMTDYSDSWTENEFDLIRIKPRAGGKDQLEKLAEELQLTLSLDVKPTFSIIQGTCQIRLDTRGIDTRPSNSKPKITEPHFDFLKAAVGSAPSFRINGESGSGKSTLANNLIAVMQQELGGCEVTLIDPKYPLSEWDIQPKYKGIDEAYDGLKEAADLVESRLKLARDDKEKGLAIRKFKPALFVIDEIDWIISHFGKEATEQLLITLKVGRALNVMILYIGQTPLCSRLKLNKDDFRHSASFFLGENIPAGIGEVVLDGALKNELEAQYTLRQEGDNKYFCMVKYPGKKPFIATSPAPNYLNFGLLPDLPKTGSPSYPELSGDNETSRDFPMDFPRLPTTSHDFPSKTEKKSKTDLALEALEAGHSKTHIIEVVWGFKGKRYAEGKALWSQLGLPD